MADNFEARRLGAVRRAGATATRADRVQRRRRRRRLRAQDRRGGAGLPGRVPPRAHRRGRRRDVGSAVLVGGCQGATAYDPAEGRRRNSCSIWRCTRSTTGTCSAPTPTNRIPTEDEFDCAELISWSCAQLGVTFPDYSVSQIDACAKAGLEISVSEASSIRGALLFRAAGHNGSQYNHVAPSLGSGNDTIEAMGKNYGVAVARSATASPAPPTSPASPTDDPRLRVG